MTTFKFAATANRAIADPMFPLPINPSVAFLFHSIISAVCEPVVHLVDAAMV